MIFTPLPDYGSMQDLWEKLIKRRIRQLATPGDPAAVVAVSRLNSFVNIQALSYMTYSNGYTSGAVVKSVKRVLTEKRVKRLDLRPLRTDEFTSQLVRIDPLYGKESEKYDRFIRKLDIRNRKRTKKDEEEEKALLAAQEEDKKGNKKSAPKKAKA
jgi:hypothetical protein